MTPSGSARLSGANTRNGSQGNDDDIINRQIQADLNLQAETHRTTPSKKVQKRKSREMDEDSDTEESPSKRRKEKDQEKRKKKKENRASKSLRGNGFDVSNDSSSSSADVVLKLTNGSDRTGKPHLKPGEIASQNHAELLSSDTNKNVKKREAKDKTRRDSGLVAVVSRSSLGTNKDALLMSILKDCSPDKLTGMKAEHTSVSESEGENTSATPKISSTSKAPSKGKKRQRVSMVPIIPEGYKPGLPGSKGRFHCPIEGCDRLYTRRSTLGEHMNTLHRGQKLRDNMDGTMTIISREDYELAILGGNDQSIVEIPDTPLPSKPTKATSQKEDWKKEMSLSTSKVLREGSVDSDMPEETETRGSRVSKSRPRSSNNENSHVGHKLTPSKVGHTERDSSDYGGSGEFNPPVNGERSERYKDPSIKSPKSKRPKPMSPDDSTLKTPATKRPLSRKSAGSRLSNPNVTHHENSEDEMEDWEIEPGTISGSDADSEDDSETEHNTAFSSVYTTDTGVKFPEVHFQVIRVPPGSVAPSPDIPYLRICSVAAGKVQVQVGDKEFSIGAHGMWRIRAHENCTLANRHYSEAVLHVSTIDIPVVDEPED